ncbi:spore germination protein [Thalassobacillus hwangdonensis]|uniref:Spore germination protein n=1 Tax=Thalassobacillus hwangdonensis TaxID=546108 RepID=A0ABW3KUU0_9BACI
MVKKRTNRSTSGSGFPYNETSFESSLKEQLNDSPDLKIKTFELNNQTILLAFLTYQINKEEMERSLLLPLTSRKVTWTNASLLNEIPLSSGSSASEIGKLAQELIKGSVGIYIVGESEAVTFFLPNLEKRALNRAETESLVFGPQISFTESLVTNLNVVRWRLDTEDLVVEKIIIGERIKSEVRLVYLKSLANDTNVNTMRQRLTDLKVDEIEDSSVLSQFIEDKSSSIFPQLLMTELPDRFCYAITRGKVGVLVDKSPTGIIGPTTLFSFFESTEDLYMRWNMGTFLRVLRIFAMIISIVLTPLYVAALTFHYEIIPQSLLISLGQSRAMVPFPPIMEALLLEILIELLREAGARLPTKVGQTMGIVGGIVLGQAAVKAGFTSNILIIVIALSALASFTAPSYLMGTAIRIIRFPMIILAGTFGLIGLMFGVAFLLIHLLKVTSLGRPYFAPIYPILLKDFDDSLFRLPFSKSNKLPLANQVKRRKRYPQEQAKKRKDIDE